MIELAVVDLSAEGRRKLAALIERWTWIGPEQRVSLPRVSINLIAPEEIRYHGSIDVCVVGPELLDCDASYISTIRPYLQGKILLCVLDAASCSFGRIEQLGRLGVDDVLLNTASPDEFIRRLLLLRRRVGAKKRGRLVFVTSARGGVGVTFTAAALGDGLASQGQRVCLVDCDVSSQDITRFLQVRPFINEPLKLLIDQQRVVTVETITECIRPVWNEKDSRLFCAPPPVGADASLFASAQASRALAAVLDALALQFDQVVVDASSLLPTTQQAVMGMADEVVFVLNRDPSGAYANRQALALLAGGIPLEAKFRVVINNPGGACAPLALLTSEVVCVPGREIVITTIPYSRKASQWACSGRTPYSDLRRAYERLLPQPEDSSKALLDRLFGVLQRCMRSAALRQISTMAGLRIAIIKQEVASLLGVPWRHPCGVCLACR
jgi:MinD-like ATPase involved in chromosome partitioning or flagellar assembly